MSWATLPPLSRASHRPPLGANVVSRRVRRPSPLGCWIPTSTLQHSQTKPAPALGFRRPPLEIPPETTALPRRPLRRVPGVLPTTLDGPMGGRPTTAPAQLPTVPQTPAVQAQPESVTVSPEAPSSPPTAPPSAQPRSPQVPAARVDLSLPVPPLAARHQKPLGNFQIPDSPVKLQRSELLPAITPLRPTAPASAVEPIRADNLETDQPTIRRQPQPVRSPTAPNPSDTTVSPRVPDAPLSDVMPPPLQTRSQPPATLSQTPPTAPAETSRVTPQPELAAPDSPPETATPPETITPDADTPVLPLQRRETPAADVSETIPPPIIPDPAVAPPVQRQAPPSNLTEIAPEIPQSPDARPTSPPLPRASPSIQRQEASDSPQIVPPRQSPTRASPEALQSGDETAPPSPPIQKREASDSAEIAPPDAREEEPNSPPAPPRLQSRQSPTASDPAGTNDAIVPATTGSPTAERPEISPATETTPEIVPLTKVSDDSLDTLRRTPPSPVEPPPSPTPGEPPATAALESPSTAPDITAATPPPLQTRTESPLRPFPRQPPPPPPTFPPPARVDARDRASPPVSLIPPEQPLQRAVEPASTDAQTRLPIEADSTAPDLAEKVILADAAESEWPPLSPAPSPLPTTDVTPEPTPIQRSLDANPAATSPPQAKDGPSGTRSPAAPVPPIQPQSLETPATTTRKAPSKKPLGWKFLRPLELSPSFKSENIPTPAATLSLQRSSPPAPLPPPASLTPPTPPSEPWQQQFQLQARVDSPSVEPWQTQFDLELPSASITPDQAEAEPPSPTFSLTSPLAQTPDTPFTISEAEAAPPTTTHTLTNEAATAATQESEKLTEAQIEQLARICYGQLRSQLSQTREYHLGSSEDLLPWFDVIAYLPIESTNQADNAPAKTDQEVSLIELLVEPKVQNFVAEVNALVRYRLRTDYERLSSPYCIR